MTITHTQDLQDALAHAGYVARRPELLALRAVEAQPGGVRALLLEGPPGAGKTHLAECYARARGAAYVYTLLHAWTDDQELFRGVDVAAAVAGDATRVHQPGVLAVAAAATRDHDLVVLCLDELDKAPERVENLLLDALQTGRVPVRPGEYIEARIDRLVVVATSNDQRPLGDALLRRFRRVRVAPLPADVVDRIAQERTGAPAGVVTMAARAARAVAAAEGNHALSLQEVCAVVRDVWTVAEDADDVREVLSQLAARTRAGAEAARRERLVAALWGEVVAARRRADGMRALAGGSL